MHTFYLDLEEGRNRILSGKEEMLKWCARQISWKLKKVKNNSIVCEHTSVAERVKNNEW